MKWRGMKTSEMSASGERQTVERMTQRTAAARSRTSRTAQTAVSLRSIGVDEGRGDRALGAGKVGDEAVERVDACAEKGCMRGQPQEGDESRPVVSAGGALGS